MPPFLDANSTTPLKPAVKQAVVEALDVYANPSSTHTPGRDARMIVDTARRQVAEAFAVRPEQVVFTSGGTEATNLALRGLMASRKDKRVITSPTEHHATLHTATSIGVDMGSVVTVLPVDAEGTIDLHALKTELEKGDVGVVSLMIANNETGLIQPVAEAAALCKSHEVPFHVDGVQAAGKLPFSFDGLGCDALSISFHKFGGPKGMGALVLKGNLDMAAVMTGGGQERNRRGGTENTAAIAGAGVAASLIDESVDDMPRIEVLRNQLEAGLKKLANDIHIVAENGNRVANTTFFITPGLDGETAIMGLDMAGVAVSGGSACSSGRVAPSHVLMAQGYDEEDARCALRVSFGWHNEEKDVDTFLTAFADVLERMRKH